MIVSYLHHNSIIVLYLYYKYKLFYRDQFPLLIVLDVNVLKTIYYDFLFNDRIRW